MSTSMLVSSLRAKGATCDEAQNYPHLFKDGHAKVLTPSTEPFQVIIDKFPPKTEEVFIHRLAWERQALLAAQGKWSINQIVILGSGLSTLPQWLLRENVTNTFFWEVDTQESIDTKTALLLDKGIDIDPRVRYVPFDFNTDLAGLSKALKVSGLNPHEHILFIWSGVSYYLPQASVEAMLNWMGSYKGSMVAFDYAPLLNANDPQVIQAQEALKAKGEPILCKPTSSQLHAMCHNAGLKYIFEQSFHQRRSFMGYPVLENDNRNLSFVVASTHRRDMTCMLNFNCPDYDKDKF